MMDPTYLPLQQYRLDHDLVKPQPLQCAFLDTSELDEDPWE